MKSYSGLEIALNWLVNHSLQAGVLVLLTLTVQWVFRRQLTARWRFALWWVVIARLLMPFSPQSALSLFNVVRPAVQVASFRQPSSAPRESEPVKMSTRPVASSANIKAQSTLPPPGDNALPVPAVAARQEPIRMAPLAEMAAARPAVTPPIEARFNNYVIPVLAGVWLAGVLILSGIVVAQVLGFHRRLGKARAPRDLGLQKLLNICREEFGVSRPVEILETGAVQSPALFGLTRLRLLLPHSMAGQFSEREWRYVFLHELAHVKRGDLWLNWLATGLQILHWFNPLIWIGFARMRADRELACDELALLRAGDKAGTAYGETVVKLLESLNRPAAIPGLVGILEDKKQMHRRISMIANFRTTGRWSILAILLVAAVAAAALTDAQSSKPVDASLGTQGATAGHNNTSTNAPKATDSTDAAKLDAISTTMTVTVLDGQTGKAVPGARVDAPYLAWLRTKGTSQTTDARGLAVIRIPKTTEMEDRMQNFSISVVAGNYPIREVMWVSDPGTVLATLPDHYTFHLQKGITVGGYVRDEHGQPVSGAKVIPWGDSYRGFSMGSGQKLHQEYSEAPRYASSGYVEADGQVTDARGFWQATNFPADLTAVRIDVVRPGGARSQFTTEAGRDMLTVEEGEQISLPDLLSTNVVLKIKDGYSIRGRVVDGTGKPVAGVRLKARGGQVVQTPIYVTTNNLDGSFELNHWIVPQFVLTAEADGFATKTVVLSAADSTAEKLVTLAPAKPMIVRVLGENNQPVAGATCQIIEWRSNNQLVDWSASSGADGLLVWTNAPDQSVTICIITTNYPPLALKLAGDGVEKQAHLRHGLDKKIAIHLTAIDAASGEPIPQFSVHRNMQWGQGFAEWGTPGTKGDFQSDIEMSEFRRGTVESFKLQVTADAYQSWTSDDLYFDEGDLNLTVKLAKGASPAGILLQPDGEPAADAKVVLCMGDGSVVFFNAPNRSYPGPGSVSVHTGSDGSFHFPGAADDQYLVAWNASGFANLTVGELRRNQEVHLQAWAKLEGVVMADGKPVANENVAIKAPLSWQCLEGFDLVYGTQTDARGHFWFTNLPPGTCVLYRQPHIIMGVETTESHRWPLELKPGEHKHVEYTFGGRQVSGHVETGVSVDWQNDAQVLALKTPPAPTPPAYFSFVNKDDYQKARIAYGHSPELLAYERQQQQFQLVFDPDGNFHADNVPPGNYELRLRVTKPPKNNAERFSVRQEDELGYLTRNVQVPAGRGVFDLGTISMTVKQGSGLTSEPAEPAKLEGKDLDGKPVTLNHLKGRYVLLAFWASWSDRCAEQLGDMAKLQSDFGKDGRVVVVGVNTDAKAEVARQTVKTRGYTWPQIRLDEPALAKAMTVFNVSSIPSYCLIGPDGCFIAHNLPHESVRAALQRALKSK